MSVEETENTENTENAEETEKKDIGLEDFAEEKEEAESDDFSKTREESTKQNVSMEALYEIPVRITAVIGTATMPVSQLVKLGRGAVVELDKKLGDAVDIYANNRLIARGEVVVVDDNHIGVTMTEILSASPTNS